MSSPEFSGGHCYVTIGYSGQCGLTGNMGLQWAKREAVTWTLLYDYWVWLTLWADIGQAIWGDIGEIGKFYWAIVM